MISQRSWLGRECGGGKRAFALAGSLTWKMTRRATTSMFFVGFPIGHKGDDVTACKNTLLLRKAGVGQGRHWETFIPGSWHLELAEREHQNQIVCLHTWPAAQHPCLHRPPFASTPRSGKEAEQPPSPGPCPGPTQGPEIPPSHSTWTQDPVVFRMCAHMSNTVLVAGSTGLGVFLDGQGYGQPLVKPHRCSKGGGLRKWGSVFFPSTCFRILYRWRPLVRTGLYMSGTAPHSAWS